MKSSIEKQFSGDMDDEQVLYRDLEKLYQDFGVMIRILHDNSVAIMNKIQGESGFGQLQQALST